MSTVFPRALFILMALAFLLAANPLHAGGSFSVDSSADTNDVDPGNNVCKDVFGDCSLRAAFEEANALDANVLIGFSSALDGMPITLTLGQLEAEVSLRVGGNGITNTIIQASDCDPAPGVVEAPCVSPEHRVLEVAVGATVDLFGVTLRHGRCAGLCETQPWDGGGILNQGTLTVRQSSITSNRVEPDGFSDGRGGAIYNLGTIAEISDSSISGNLSENDAGAIYNDGTITEITDSLFEGNHASNAGQSTEGGALYNSGPIALIDSTVFTGGTADQGGAIYNEDEITTIGDSTFHDNEGFDRGGAIYNEVLIGEIIRSTFSNNTTSDLGGAIDDNSGEIGAIVNSTFSGNMATDKVSDGGAIRTTGSVGTIINSTIVGNSAAFGGGFWGDNSTVVVNTIIADNTPSNCGGTDPLDDGGGNFDDDDTCVAEDIVPGVDYDTVLANNGGPTETHSLLAGSVAIDAAGACPVELEGVDQRRFPRFDDSCDSGSVDGGVIFTDGFESGDTSAWSLAVSP